MAANADRREPGGLAHEAARACAAGLFLECHDAVERICRAMLRDAAEAEDAAQQTFLAAFQALLGGTRPREPHAWLATIARNECRHRIRARMRAPLVATAEAGDAARDVHGEALARAEAALLWDELRRLPAPQREALVLRELGGRSYAEVASEIGVSTAAVESLLFRARARLRERLRAALRTLDVAGAASAVSGAVARLVTGDLAPRVAAPFVVKGALVTAGAVTLGGGALATEKQLAHPYVAPPVAAARIPHRVVVRAPQPRQAAPVALRRAVPSAVVSKASVAGPVAGRREGSDGRHGHRIALTLPAASGDHRGDFGRAAEDEHAYPISSGPGSAPATAPVERRGRASEPTVPPIADPDDDRSAERGSVGTESAGETPPGETESRNTASSSGPGPSSSRRGSSSSGHGPDEPATVASTDSRGPGSGEATLTTSSSPVVSSSGDASSGGGEASGPGSPAGSEPSGGSGSSEQLAVSERSGSTDGSGSSGSSGASSGSGGGHDSSGSGGGSS